MCKLFGLGLFFGALWVQDNGELSDILKDLQGVDYSPAYISRIANEIKGLSAAKINELGIDYVKATNGKSLSHKKAVTMFRIAAAKGETAAEAKMGFMYHQGFGVSQNFAEALRWFRMAAEKGDPKAQFNLGLMYGNGQGVDEDVELALDWFKKSARQGYANAQAILKQQGVDW